jgi:hypothetical protein
LLDLFSQTNPETLNFGFTVLSIDVSPYVEILISHKILHTGVHKKSSLAAPAETATAFGVAFTIAGQISGHASERLANVQLSGEALVFAF